MVALAEDRPLPAGGAPLLGENPLRAFTLGERPPYGHTERVAVAGAPFTEAIRARTDQRPEHPWFYQITARTIAPVKKGDVLFARFFARRIESRAESGEAETEFVFEKHGEPWSKHVTHPVRVGPGWARIHVPFVAQEGHGTGGAQVAFRLGYHPQVIEIGGLELWNFGQSVALRDLPQSLITYRGIEVDAPWRKTAAARIEKLRKGDLRIVVTDARGRAVRGARVEAQMRRHAFAFGTAVDSARLLGRSKDSEKYRETLLRLFNTAVLENDLKWGNWERNRNLALRGVAWLRENGLDVRGHCLVWPGWQWLPRDLPSLQSSPDALRKRIEDHILNIAGALRGRVSEWDVLNEPYSNRDVQRVLGDEAMAEWFRLARQADPGAALFINDFGILSGGGEDRAHQDHYFETIRFLQRHNAPIGGIGMQGHFGAQLTPPERVWEILDRFGALGLPIRITEHDIDITNEEAQAAYTRDFLTACFAHPAVSGFLVWGFWEGQHWKPNGAYFRRDWTVKPAGQAWMDLVLKEWWTTAAGQTDRRGELTARGFLGEYDIVVRHRGQTRTAAAALPREGATVTIALD